jgi:chromosome partition protein MukE
MSGELGSLQDAIDAEVFPDVDLALRRGRHIDRDDGEWYPFLLDAQALLEAFYRRFGCELIHRTDGYFYLLPTSDRLGRRHLSSGEMLVGQALTLLYLDPATVEHGGVLTRDQVLAQLAGVMGAEALVRAMNPKRRRYDERVAEEAVRSKVAEALRRLATLGFVEIVEETRIRLRPALMRFAEPARAAAAPEGALERLVAAGELVLTESDDPDLEGAELDDPDGTADPEGAPDPEGVDLPEVRPKAGRHPEGAFEAPEDPEALE